MSTSQVKRKANRELAEAQNAVKKPRQNTTPQLLDFGLSEQAILPRGSSTVPKSQTKRTIETIADKGLFATTKSSSKDPENPAKTSGKDKDTKDSKDAKGKDAVVSPDADIKTSRLHDVKQLNKIQHISHKTISVGDLFYGTIRKVTSIDIKVSLPNGLSGYVSLREAGDIVSHLVDTHLEREIGVNLHEGNNSSDDALDVDALPSLQDMYQVGQPIRVIVIKVERALKKNVKKHIELSMRPSFLNAHLSADLLHQNMSLPGEVESIESRGYIIHYGLSFKGFLPFIQDQQQLDVKYRPGQIVNTVILRQIPKDARSVQVSNTQNAFRLAVIPKTAHVSFESFRPGQTYQAVVSRIMKDGIIVRILSLFDVSIPQFHLRRPIEKYNPLDEIEVCLVHVNPSTRIIIGSTHQSLMYNDNFHGFSHIADVGEVKPVVVERVVNNLGVLVRFPSLKNGNTNIGVPNSLYSPDTMDDDDSQDDENDHEDGKAVSGKGKSGAADSKKEASAASLARKRRAELKNLTTVHGWLPFTAISDTRLDQIPSKFKPGATISVRVTGYNHFDHLIIVSSKQSVLESAALSYNDLIIGKKYTATVKSIQSNGVIFNLAPYVTGYVPNLHLTNAGSANPSQRVLDRFAVGSTHDLRIMICDPVQKKVICTCKPGMVNREEVDEVFHNYAHAREIFQEYRKQRKPLLLGGYVDKVQSGYVVVRFFNNICGITTKSQLIQDGLITESQTPNYSVGDFILVRVIAVSGDKLNISFKTEADDIDQEKRLRDQRRAEARSSHRAKFPTAGVLLSDIKIVGVYKDTVQLSPDWSEKALEVTYHYNDYEYTGLLPLSQVSDHTAHTEDIFNHLSTKEIGNIIKYAIVIDRLIIAPPKPTKGSQTEPEEETILVIFTIKPSFFVVNLPYAVGAKALSQRQIKELSTKISDVFSTTTSSVLDAKSKLSLLDIVNTSLTDIMALYPEHTNISFASPFDASFVGRFIVGTIISVTQTGIRLLLPSKIVVHISNATLSDRFIRDATEIYQRGQSLLAMIGAPDADSTQGFIPVISQPSAMSTNSIYHQVLASYLGSFIYERALTHPVPALKKKPPVSATVSIGQILPKAKIVKVNPPDDSSAGSVILSTTATTRGKYTVIAPHSYHFNSPELSELLVEKNQLDAMVIGVNHADKIIHVTLLPTYTDDEASSTEYDVDTYRELTGTVIALPESNPLLTVPSYVVAYKTEASEPYQFATISQSILNYSEQLEKQIYTYGDIVTFISPLATQDDQELPPSCAVIPYKVDASSSGKTKSASKSKAKAKQSDLETVSVGEIVENAIVQSYNERIPAYIIAFPGDIAGEAVLQFSELSDDPVEDPQDLYTVGDIIPQVLIIARQQGNPLSFICTTRESRFAGFEDDKLVLPSYLEDYPWFTSKHQEFPHKVDGMVSPVELRTQPEDDVTPVKFDEYVTRSLSIYDILPHQLYKAYITGIDRSGVYVNLTGLVSARIQLKNVTDEFLTIDQVKSKFSIGDILDVRVTTVDYNSGMVEATSRASQTDLVDYSILKKLKPGDVIKGTVTNIIEAGVFIKVNRSKSLIGLSRRSECVDDKMVDFTTYYKPGDKVKAVVLGVNPTRKRLALGLRASLFTRLDEIKSRSTEVVSQEDGSSLTGVLTLNEDDSSDADEDDEDEDDEDEDMEDSEDDIEDEDEEESEDPHLAHIQQIAATESSIAPTVISAQKKAKKATMDDDSDDEEEEELIPMDIESDSMFNKLTATQRQEQEERRIEQLEHALMTNDTPQTAEQYEIACTSSPNDSGVWIQYIAFLLQNHDVTKARQIGQQALNVIHVNLVDEHWNIWCALISLEILYGTPSSLAKFITKAKVANDLHKIYTEIARVYNASDKYEFAVEYYQKALRELSPSRQVDLCIDVYNAWIDVLFRANRRDEAHQVLKQASGKISAKNLFRVTLKVMVLEFRSEHGNPDNGRVMFLNYLKDNVKKLDIWFIYISQEVRFLKQLSERVNVKRGAVREAKQRIRDTFNILTQSSQSKHSQWPIDWDTFKPVQMRSIFKRAIEFESDPICQGDTKVKEIQAKAKLYVDYTMNKGSQ